MTAPRKTREQYQEETDQLLARLSAGVENLKTSDEWRSYLDTQRKFHHYSFGNTLLIAMQRPDAERVASYKKWLELGRQVRKGETGIRILAPCTRTITDRETDEKKTIVSGFTSVSVFDVSQTDGEPLAEIPVRRLTGDGAAIDELTSYATAAGWTVKTAPLPGSTNGVCDYSAKTLVVRPDLEPAQHTKTLVHELAHALMHGPACSIVGMDRTAVELEAESVAYVVCSHLGIDTSSYSFGYLASWRADAKTIKSSGGRIQKTAHEILDAIKTQEEVAA